jgi:hypothetical protein
MSHEAIAMILDSPLGKRARQELTSLGKAAAKVAEQRAASKIQHLFRRKFNKYKIPGKLVGEDPTLSTAKVTRLRSDGMQSQDSNTLYWIAPLQIDRRNTTTYLLNQRERDLIYLSGFKICMKVELTSAETFNQYYFNLALVSCDQYNWIVGDEIFRNYTGTQRAKDFSSSDLTCQERHCTPLNTDRYTVHKHIRTTLSPTYEKTQALLQEFEFYVPIKRQIRYTGDGNDDIATKFRLIWWYGAVGATVTESLLANRVINCAKEEHFITAVFREPEVLTNLRRPRRRKY